MNDVMIRTRTKLSGWPIMVFQVLRHWMVVKLICLPVFTVGFGYYYLSEGEVPEGRSEDDIRRS